MKLSDVEDAAFWGRWVCLACEGGCEGEAFEHLSPDETACPECGDDAIYPAELLLRIYHFVEDE